MGGRGLNAVWSTCKLYMAIMCSLPGGPGDILCLHRFPRDTICQKDCVSAGRTFQVWNLIITYFNSLGRASFWHRRRGYLLSKPAFLYLSRDISATDVSTCLKAPHTGTSLLRVNISPLKNRTAEVMKRKFCDHMVLTSTSMLRDLGQVISVPVQKVGAISELSSSIQLQ